MGHEKEYRKGHKISIVADVLGALKIMWLITVAAVLWSVWLAHNDKVFNGKLTTPKDILFSTELRALMWVKASEIGLISNEERGRCNPIFAWRTLEYLVFLGINQRSK
ncbi:hypothetical protein GQ457_17G003960 [Hibiscus cannabinus]